MIDPTGHEANLNLDPPDEPSDELELVYDDLLRTQRQNEELRKLCARAADALAGCTWQERDRLIYELRKAAE